MSFLVVVVVMLFSSTTALIKSCNYRFNDGGRSFDVHFDSLSSSSSSTTTSTLVLNGFGVGTFHQHKLMNELHKIDSLQTINALDVIGQGDSWPVIQKKQEPSQFGTSINERNLEYSAALWLRQIEFFIQNFMQEPKIDIVGNSLGGYLAIQLAARLPSSKVRRICLLNATPLWGANLPGFNGILPANFLARNVGFRLFDLIRKTVTIKSYLNAAYHQFNDDELVQLIQNVTTNNQGGHAAFASILFTPNAGLPSTDEAIRMIPQDSEVCLVFGANDPWCTPAVARAFARRFQAKTMLRYFSLKNCGHCPNNEQPTITADIISNPTSATSQQPETDFSPSNPFETFQTNFLFE